VHTELKIARPRAEVAAYACDPDNAREWYANVESVQWRTDPPLAVGSQIAFTASFMGRRLSYTYEVTELIEGERFVMCAADGPFPMETTYTFHDTPDGATIMTLRNRGEPTGLLGRASPVVARAIARANGRDLRRLRRVLCGA
jgi:hypothetical protein